MPSTPEPESVWDRLAREEAEAFGAGPGSPFVAQKRSSLWGVVLLVLVLGLVGVAALWVPIVLR